MVKYNIYVFSLISHVQSSRNLSLLYMYYFWNLPLLTPELLVCIILALTQNARLIALSLCMVSHLVSSCGDLSALICSSFNL